MRRFSESLLSIVVTAALVIGACALMFSHAVNQQRADLAPLREQNDALRAQADDNRRQIEATTQLLRTAINDRQGEVFSPEDAVQKLNGQRMDALADAIAVKIAPKLPAPQTPDQLAQQQNEAVDQISSRTAEKLQPTIAQIGDQQKASAQTIASYQARLNQVTDNLQQTQAAADQAIQLSHQLSSMYLDTYKDHGVVVRVLSLPAEVIRDAAGGNIINDRQRKQEQQQLNTKLQDIENRLNQIRAQGTQPVASNN